ncbi:hypothetical protein ACLMAL_26465 [Nocardia sp. CWNU-33]|uniref:hypothetical protein n=1 Tax=Nocardia sp. CWNU-33 TaxID=3392117 RepID=UPI00398F269F
MDCENGVALAAEPRECGVHIRVSILDQAFRPYLEHQLHRPVEFGRFDIGEALIYLLLDNGEVVVVHRDCGQVGDEAPASASAAMIRGLADACRPAVAAALDLVQPAPTDALTNQVATMPGTSRGHGQSLQLSCQRPPVSAMHRGHAGLWFSTNCGTPL